MVTSLKVFLFFLHYVYTSVLMKLLVHRDCKTQLSKNFKLHINIKIAKINENLRFE